MELYKIIAIVLIAFILGFVIGFNSAAYVTIKAVAKIGSGFIDEGMVRQALYQYQNNIGLCFPSNFTI